MSDVSLCQEEALKTTSLILNLLRTDKSRRSSQLAALVVVTVDAAYKIGMSKKELIKKLSLVCNILETRTPRKIRKRKKLDGVKYWKRP